MPAKLASVLSISLILASSCADPSDIGLELDPENNQIGVFYAEIPLSASMILMDSVNTTNHLMILAGGHQSDYFGTTESIGFTRMFIDTRADRPSENAVLDSVKFQFEIISPIGSSFAQDKTLQVHQLQEPIEDISYYNYDRLAFNPSPLATGTFRLTANRDTIVRTDVNEQFANQFFNDFKSGSNAFSDIFAFRNYFNGIAIQGDVNENTSLPVRVGPNTGMFFYYHNEGDTLPSTYTVSTSQSRRFNYVNNDRSGTPLESVQETFVPYEVGNIVGAKGNTGLLIRLDTSPIDAFLDTLQNVTFNQVTLEMAPLEETTEAMPPFRTNQMLFLNDDNQVEIGFEGNPLSVQNNERSQQIIGPDNTILPAFENPAGLEYVNGIQGFSVVMTSYLNAVFRSDLERRNLLIFPNEGYYNTLREYRVNTDNIKLKVYYSTTR
ncbi:hypothetical protein KI659_15240 [Litoribacter alkaliphilus]|uniref:DUF4270 family protein n=1 Tax=Litoribacter ruber TaxID=702568 RepID=A0AAP2CII3_9BACT|nr:DUF4270 family protein [Litoribacter alkaliphilus]MBS9525373.1 hypothetical protein [Litoribacter alkaliphilus]